MPRCRRLFYLGEAIDSLGMLVGTAAPPAWPRGLRPHRASRGGPALLGLAARFALEYFFDVATLNDHSLAAKIDLEFILGTVNEILA